MAGPDPKPAKHGREPSKKVAAGQTVLPGARRGPVPKPRTEVPISDEGMSFWADLWGSPQSAMWMPLPGRRPAPMHHVAVRLLLAFETMREDGFSTAVSIEMRQLEHTLGLTPKAMKELGWVVGEPAPKTESTPPPSRYGHLSVADQTG